MKLQDLLRYEIGMLKRAGGIRAAAKGFWRRQVLGPKTTRWQWSVLPPNALYEPRLLFSNIPPVSVSGVDDRVLICCTKAQMREMSKEPPVEGSRVIFSTQVGLFWEELFDGEYFCDRPVTVPSLLATTGYMRNYNYIGGETVEVGEYLENTVTDMFSIPFVRLGWVMDT